MVEAMLFELEGALVETREVRRSALVEALEEEGVAISASEYDEACDGLTPEDAARAAAELRGVYLDDTAAGLVALRVRRRFYQWLGKGVSLVPGARQLVVSAAGRARLGIVTRASRDEVNLVLALARAEDGFECIITGDDPHEPKPSPAPYLAMLERLGRRRPVAPAHVVALEASSPGIRAARAAGLRCVAVGPLPAHRAMDADALIPSLADHTLQTIERLVYGETERAR